MSLAPNSDWIYEYFYKKANYVTASNILSASLSIDDRLIHVDKK